MAYDISKWGKMYRHDTMVAAQNAAMLGTMVGYLPPARLGFIRSCLHPNHVHSSGGCMDGECKLGASCKGNRIEWVPGSSNTKLRMSFPHHKCEAKWNHLPIEFEVPKSLTDRLMPWITMGHKELAAPNQRLLFVHPRSGMGLTAVNVSQWFQELLCNFRAPFRFPPSQLRHIFVDERCSAEHVAGPSGQGAARIMGNSVGRWAISYDKNLHTREVQAAVDAMEQWRSELLALIE